MNIRVSIVDDANNEQQWVVHDVTQQWTMKSNNVYIQNLIIEEKG